MVAAAGAMVVLGEPGAGKTSVLTELTSALPRVVDLWGGESDACLWVSGGDLTEGSFGEELGRHLAALPPTRGGGTDVTGVLTVVLDQADESSYLRHLPRRLKNALQSRDISRVRVLIACRTADYPMIMTDVLSDVFGSCRCIDLAPLTREEAETLADSADVPGKSLVDAAEAAGAAVLASVPLTLELLVLTYRIDGQLHGTPQELFARGVHRLVEDPDPDRLTSAMVTTGQQRLAVAGRVAAWMLLSGHRTVWRGAAFGAGDFDLSGDVLAGGTERTVAGAFEATPQVLEETLATALFTVPDNNRVVFRHSSVTAYLAARHLVDRETTQRQLANLLLVGAPEGEASSIPVPLREVAAWLVAMNPTATDWLAAADPESLAVHSALVRSDDVRRLTVSKLLDRAAQVELSDLRWQLSRWDLHYPGLADQLTEVLEAAPIAGAVDWQTTARTRLAIQLAQEAGTGNPRLADALLRLVENHAWDEPERRLAARAAFACDANRAVPVLTGVLASLDDSSRAARIDPQHDLRGTVLALLWPEHIDVSTMLASLRPPAPYVYNNYAQFLKNMPSKCADDHLPDLLAWVQKTVLNVAPPAAGFDYSTGRIENSLIESAIDRALGAPDPQQHISSMARIIIGLFRDHHEIRIPDCLQPGEQAQETQATQALRRLLAEALVKEADRAKIDPRQAAWMIVQDWRSRSTQQVEGPAAPEMVVRNHLLDGTDFAWALEQTAQAARSGDDALVAAYGELAACVFPRDDREAFDLASNEEHPAWPYLSSFFAPIVIDSQLGRALRKGHRARNTAWEDAPLFVAEQMQLLVAARMGDNDSLALFLRRLQIDPGTGHAGELSGAIHTWPGVRALNDELTDLPELALRFLTSEHDHADSLPAASEHGDHPWVGYALLTELHSANRLTELPSKVWESWAGAILTEFLGMSSSFSETVRKDLLRQAAHHAPESLAQRITQLVWASLANARQPVEIYAVNPDWAPEVCTAMERLLIALSACLGLAQRVEDDPGPSALLDEKGGLRKDDDGREAALQTWYRLLVSLLAAGRRTAVDVVDTALEERAGSPDSEQVAVLAACSLLMVDAKSNWRRVKAYMGADTELGRHLAEECAGTEVARRIHSSFEEAELADLYVWLSALYGPEEDVILPGVSRVTAEAEARRWRDGVLRELSRRATADAVRQLRQLAAQNPDRLAVAAALVASEKQYASDTWSQVQADDVIRVLQDPARRVIRTSTDLLDIACEALEEINEELPSHCELLWDRIPGKRPKKSATSADNKAIPDRWRPKPEAALCAYLTHELRLRLAGHRVAVNREVLVRPTDASGAGDRTDILIDTLPPPGEDTAAAIPVRLVIEVKGAWNPGVMTSQEDQLAARYLPEVRTDSGIYLVGWFPVELWDDPEDRRKTEAKKHPPEAMLADLRKQSMRLSQTGSVDLRPIVLTIPRPHKS
ncbi:hypothetical protein CJ177_46375 [Rhodococcus sp. ACPA1]|nr:hypothetical protein CJ177_46375 [Rhodococcus sp. ACPA1]